MDSTTMTLPLRSWHLICFSSRFMLFSWHLIYIMPIFCQHSKGFITRSHVFFRMVPHQKQTGILHSQTWSGSNIHPVWTAVWEVCQLPLPRLPHTKLFFSPRQNAEQKPLLRQKSMENTTSFMKSVVQDCQVDHSDWICDRKMGG